MIFYIKLLGLNGLLSNKVVLPSNISSDINNPDVGEYNIPQHPWPDAIHNPFVLGTLPIIGIPRLQIGRWQACSVIILAVGFSPSVCK